jgi:methylmalonyl-CoA mutase N-terminal domain/subunit
VSANSEPVYPYRGSSTGEPYSIRPWILGQYSGFAGPDETNRRFRSLIDEGQKGLAIALDLPTQLGLDPDDDEALGEVGKVGVSLARLADMESLFAGIRLCEVTQISTTANSIGPIMIALFRALALKRGEDISTFSLRLQNDVLKEYVARGTQVLPPAPAVEFTTDAVEYCVKEAPHWVPISISGYHMRDAGASREQELGFTLANARCYIDAAARRGISAADFARTITWFLSAAPQVVEETAKFRAARELWATTLHDEYGVPVDDPALRLRIIAYTLGGEMSAFEIMGNSVRVTLSALAATLGGAQTLFCSAIDEALGIPTDANALHSLRTQQIILKESGIAEWVDVLGGSNVAEQITSDLIEQARMWDRQVAERGGSTSAIADGWMREIIDESSWQREIAQREHRRVGEPSASDPTRLQMFADNELFAQDPTYEERRREEFAQWREDRDPQAVATATADFRASVLSGENLVEPCTRALLADLSLGEIMGVLVERYGRVSGSAA